jgi:hypothetical protein
MPLPPLAPSERRLAQLASGVSWLCLTAGVAVLVNSVASSVYAPRERLFVAATGAALFSMFLPLRRTAASPRDDRRAFAQLLWMLSISALAMFLAWRRDTTSSAPGVAALVSALLWAGLGFVYFRAAPGVNLGAVVAPPADAPAKAVQLGVRVAPAPIPAAPAVEATAEPKAAAAASLG